MVLRLTNLAFSLFIIPGLVSSILAHLDERGGPLASTSRTSIIQHTIGPSPSAITISAFPLIFFFGNLYYTDVASLAGVLAVLALAQSGRHWSAALVSV